MPKCVICNSEFKPTGNHLGITCGDPACRREHRRRGKATRAGRELGDISERPCTICGTQFRPRSPIQQTCSDQRCKQQWRNKVALDRYNANRDKSARECPICKRRFVPHFEHQRTCGGSRCLAAMKRMNSKMETRACLNCSTEFKAMPDEKRKFCCRPCADDYRERQELARLAAEVVCPFPDMSTGIMGMASWDCPEMDPFGAGHYQVRPDMGEAQIERRAA